MQQASEQGHLDAMFTLAMHYRGDNESGTKENADQMMFYLKMAADSQMAKAQRMLGFAYRDGDGVTKNRMLAIHYLRLASEQGDKAAKYELELLEEEDAEARLREAEELCRLRESTPTDPEELYLIGIQYREGRGESGTAGKRGEAARYFRLAADQGHAKAQFILGTAYRDGDGVQQDFNEAANLFKLSANQNHPESIYELAFCYYSGRDTILKIDFFAFNYLLVVAGLGLSKDLPEVYIRTSVGFTFSIIQYVCFLEGHAVISTNCRKGRCSSRVCFGSVLPKWGRGSTA